MRGVTLFSLCILAAMSWDANHESDAQDKSWRRMDRGDFCVASGSIEGAAGDLAIDASEVRASLRAGAPQAVELRFTYLGPSEKTTPLASGEVRRQIGIKLRAQDTCNVVYVMWHISPDTRIAVSVKRNLGRHAHAECGDKGYIGMRPAKPLAMPPILPGSVHTLRAVLFENRLEVYADDKSVFNRALDLVPLDFDGPPGLRTDNALFRFQYFTGAYAFGPSAQPLDLQINQCR
jgi:hypothetical protein